MSRFARLGMWGREARYSWRRVHHLPPLLAPPARPAAGRARRQVWRCFCLRSGALGAHVVSGRARAGPGQGGSGSRRQLAGGPALWGKECCCWHDPLPGASPGTPNLPPAPPPPNQTHPCSWEVPWADGNAWQLVGQITQGGRLPIPPPDQLPGPDRLPPAAMDAYVALIERCWAQNQYERPDFGEVIAVLR